MKFVERREFLGDPDELWKRVSNIEMIPTYWHGTRELIIKRSEGKVTAAVVFAFGGRGRAEITTDDAAKTLTLDYVEGPFKGKQTVAVKEQVIEADWDVTFRGAYRVLGPWNASHFRSGTRNALARLCDGLAA